MYLTKTLHEPANDKIKTTNLSAMFNHPYEKLPVRVLPTSPGQHPHSMPMVSLNAVYPIYLVNLI